MLFTPQKKIQTISFNTNNYLTVSYYSINIPNDWIFSHARTNQQNSSSALFYFYDSKRQYYGAFVIEKTDQHTDINTFKQYYISRIKNKLSNIKAVKTVINNKEAIILRGTFFNKILQTETLIYPLSSSIILIEINYPIDNSSKNQTIANNIIKGLSLKRNIKEERKLPSGLHFVSLNGNWRWYSDTKGGFIVNGQINNQKGFIGIWETDYNTIQEVKQAGNPDLKIFNAFFYINSNKILAKGTGNIGNKQNIELFYLLKYRGKPYTIYINYNNSDGGLNPLKVHLSKEIVYFFNNCLLLEEPTWKFK